MVQSVRFYSTLKGGEPCDVTVVRGQNQITVTCRVGVRKIMTAKLAAAQQ